MVDYKQAYEWLFDAVGEIINEQCDKYDLIVKNVTSGTANIADIEGVLVIARDTLQKIVDVLEESETKLEAAERNEESNDEI